MCESRISKILSVDDTQSSKTHESCVLHPPCAFNLMKMNQVNSSSSTSSSGACEWTPTASYIDLFTGYFKLYYPSESDLASCKALSESRPYYWSDLIVIFALTYVIFFVQGYTSRKILNLFLRYFENSNEFDASKASKYSIEIMERIIHLCPLGYFLLYDSPCKAIWDLNQFKYASNTSPALIVMQSVILAKSIVHATNCMIECKYEKRKDFFILFSHHVITCCLMFSARYSLLVSLWTLFVHEICDPFIYLLKLTNVLHRITLTSKKNLRVLIILGHCRVISCLLLPATWLIFRLYVFPLRIGYGAVNAYFAECRFTFGKVTIFLGFILLFMHFFWFFLIVKVLILVVFKGTWVDTTVNDGQRSREGSQAEIRRLSVRRTS